MHNIIGLRIKKILYSLLAVFVLLALRLVCVQLSAAKPLSDIASQQYHVAIELLPKRGIIYDRNLKEIAININLGSVFAEPFRIKDKSGAAQKLAPLLKVDAANLTEKLNEERGFVWLGRKVQPDIEKAIRELNIKGIYVIKEPQRAYPHGNIASHILGFTDIDNNGLEGIELKFDKFLKGVSGWRYTIRDARQREVPSYETRETQPVDGNNMVLTIDTVVQTLVETELEDAYKKYHAKGGTIIVMNPWTGDILALANRPTYNLNNPKGFAVDARRNRALTDFFEPGSSFKIVAASALLEEKEVRMDEKFFCENGSYKWAGHVYHDHKPHGWLTFSDVIKYSSNIGTMKAAQRLGKERLYKYIRKFGFGEKTGIELPGEVSGVTAHPGKWSKLSLCSMAMGQEVTVTAVQLACAISAIANGGYLVRPRMAELIQDKSGSIIQKFKHKEPERIISQDTAEKMRKILREVVDNGTAKLAELEDYLPAGKTGTGQKIEPDGTYSHRKFTASFIGFVPFDNPRFAIAIVLDEPRPFYYGGVVCAPVFKKVASELMSYYEVEPIK